MSRIAIPAALLALTAFLPCALADTSPEDRAAADALFAEAGKLVHENRWAEACPKLEASIKLDPAIGAMLHLAECYEKTGRNASAWSTLHDAYDLARKAGDARAKEAEDRASLITIPAQSQGMEVLRDQTRLSAGAFGTPVPIDPGEHTIDVTQPGKQAWKKTITIEAKPGMTTIAIPPLADAPGAWSPAVAGSTALYWNGQRIAGVAVAGVGLASIVAGATFGGLSIAKKNGLANDCHGTSPEMCTAAGVDLHDQALTFANVSNATLAVGGAAAVAGAVLFFTAPNGGAGDTKAGVSAAALVTPEARGVWIRGRW